MTVANCRRLLKHYEDTNQTTRALEAKRNLDRKLDTIKQNLNNPNSPHYKYKFSEEFRDKPKEEPKLKEDKKDGKKSKGQQ